MAQRRRRRWPLVAGTGAFWFLFVPNWRPALGTGERYGVDVSSHQGDIDWRQVAGDGIRFAYIKATEGADFTVARFDENWLAAGDAGLRRGAYHFFTLCRSGREQATHFLTVAPPDAGALAPAVDLELVGNCSRRPDRDAVDAEVRTFVAVVEEAWNRPMTAYVGDDWERRYPVRVGLDRPLWHFRFLRRPNVDGWVIWQIHGFARVDGIRGSVDLDVMRD